MVALRITRDRKCASAELQQARPMAAVNFRARLSSSLPRTVRLLRQRRFLPHVSGRPAQRPQTPCCFCGEAGPDIDYSVSYQPVRVLAAMAGIEIGKGLYCTGSMRGLVAIPVITQPEELPPTLLS